jgi:hypothetical protein
VENQGHFNGPSYPPAPYTNPVNNTDGFFHGTPQGALSDTSSPRYPPGNHHHLHTQSPSSPLISDHPAFSLGGSHWHNMEASRAFPLDVTQATQGGIGGSMTAVNSIQQPALSPQAGSIGMFPIQTRNTLPCPVEGCPSSLSRTQDQRRHLLTHLPHWIHCPAPECCWRGDRFDAFVRHWGNDHPPGIRVPDEGLCRTYDPQPLMKEISEGSLCIQVAQKRAISMVKKRASELQKLELLRNPWGRRWKRRAEEI